jgi:hypothetical protein
MAKKEKWKDAESEPEQGEERKIERLGNLIYEGVLGSAQ